MEANNTQKMREALEAVLKCIWYKKSCTVLMDGSAYIENYEKQIREALSAPARNCDLFLTLKDAVLAHLEEVYEGEKVDFGEYEWLEFVKWLFAEAKGETK